MSLYRSRARAASVGVVFWGQDSSMAVFLQNDKRMLRLCPTSTVTLSDREESYASEGEAYGAKILQWLYSFRMTKECCGFALLQLSL